MTTEELDLGLMHPLQLTSDQVARMTRSERERRLDELVESAHTILDDGITRFVNREGRELAGVVGLFSGGNDSTTLVHLLRDRLDYVAHTNTGIGIEETREFVRSYAASLNIPLLERRAPNERDHYRNLVLTAERGKEGQALGGFPGPAMHWKMYTRLKERAFRVVQAELLTNSRTQRLVFTAGRRRAESARRAAVPEHDVRGPVLWVSPLVYWTKLDLNTYRLRHRLPVNTASALVHMSGECLCGSMASPGERAELAHWFPGDFADIEAIEAALADRTDIPDHRKRWGWGADPAMKQVEKAYLATFAATDEEPDDSDAPNLCGSCDTRAQAALFDLFGGDVA